MIRKAVQAVGMMLIGGAILVGSLWLISLRPGFVPHVPHGWSQTETFLIFTLAVYKLLLGVDFLVAAWAVGWIAVAVLSRRALRGEWFSGLDAVRPPQVFLGGLLLLQLFVVLLGRGDDFPPVYFLWISREFSWGASWTHNVVGGNAATLGLLVGCAAVALWYLSGALGCSRHQDVPTPTVMPAHRWAKQVAIGCIEIIVGFALLMFLPVAAESIAREFRPSGWFFWEGEVIPFHLFGFSLSDHHFHFWFGDASWPAWVGLTLGLAAASWAFGLVALAAVGRLMDVTSENVRQGEEARWQVAKRVLVWLLGVDCLLAVALPPEGEWRFSSIVAPYSGDVPSLKSWAFSLDLWLALVALAVVALTVLHLSKAAFSWLDRRSSPTPNPLRRLKTVGIIAGCAVLIVVGALVCFPHLFYRDLKVPHYLELKSFHVDAFVPFATPTPVPPPPPSTEEAVAHGIRGADNIVFWRGLNNFSTGSSLVLVQVIDARTRQRHTACVDRRALIDAIVTEHGLGVPRVRQSDAKAITFALAQPDRTFVFSKAEALALVPRGYPDSILALAHSALDPLSDSEIITGFSRRGHLHRLYDGSIHIDATARYFAIGQVLIERHLLPSWDCFPGRLYVQE